MDGFIPRVNAMIQARGITVNALGERAGLQRGHINHILSGTRKTVNADTLLAIARALGVTTDWLLTGEGPIERPSSTVPVERPVSPVASALSDVASELGKRPPPAKRSTAKR